MGRPIQTNMKIAIVITLVAVYVSLTEAKHIKTKRAASRDDLLRELDRELKNYINRRDDGDNPDDATPPPPAPPTTDPSGNTNLCRKEITEDLKNKVKDREDEILGAVNEMGKDIYFTALIFAGIGSDGKKIDLTTGFVHLSYFLHTLGIVASTQRGEQYVIRFVEDTQQIAMISIARPDIASRIISIGVESIDQYFKDNFPPSQTDDSQPAKRGKDELGLLDADKDKDQILKNVAMMLCKLSQRDWKAVETDVDKIIDEGLEMIRATSSLLRSMRAIAASERVESWGQMSMMGLQELARLTEAGNKAKLDEAFDHAQKIREYVEKAIAEAFKPPTQPGMDVKTDTPDNRKRILHGMSKDDLRQFLDDALKLYQLRK